MSRSRAKAHYRMRDNEHTVRADSPLDMVSNRHGPDLSPDAFLRLEQHGFQPARKKSEIRLAPNPFDKKK